MLEQNIGRLGQMGIPDDQLDSNNAEIIKNKIEQDREYIGSKKRVLMSCAEIELNEELKAFAEKYKGRWFFASDEYMMTRGWNNRPDAIYCIDNELNLAEIKLSKSEQELDDEFRKKLENAGLEGMKGFLNGKDFKTWDSLCYGPIQAR